MRCEKWKDQDQQPANNESGFALLPILGVLAIMTIGVSVLIPNMPTLHDQQATSGERTNLESISKGTELYMKTNAAWPTNLATHAPNYVPFDAANVSQNPRGFPRYYFPHPNTAGFSNGTGLASRDIENIKFLLISNLKADAAPTITNATEFDTWWGTASTENLHIHKGNMARQFSQINLSAEGKGGSFHIAGTTTNSSGGTLGNYNQYHVKGTTISLDEASTYGTPEVQLVLTGDATYTYVPCLPSGRKWAIPPVPPCPVLWVSTSGNATGTPGVTWKDNEVVSFVDPNLTFETGPTGQTNGTFANVIDLEDFTSSADIDAGHYVGEDLLVGGINLLEGDLLLSTESSESLTSLNSLFVRDEDVFIFRPSSLDDYSSGTFIMLLDGSDIFGSGGDCDEGSVPICDLEGMTLVEVATTVGGQALSSGDILLTGDSRNVWRFTPTSLGASTSGTLALLIDGNDIDIDEEWEGIELIEVETEIGDTMLQPGQILGSIEQDDSSFGDNQINVQSNDVFILNLTSTGSSTVGSASILFDGSDVGLSSSSNEVIDMVTLNGNGGGTTASIGTLIIANADFETGDLTGWTKTGDLQGNGGANQWGVETDAYYMSSPHGGSYFGHGEYQSRQTGGDNHLTGIYQRVDVSANATDIDAGGVTVTIDGFGFGETGNDVGFIRIAFYDQISGGSQLGGDVNSNNATTSQTWTALSISSQAVPTGTRSIEILLLGDIDSSSDGYTDAGFDDLSGSLTLP